MSVSGPTFRLPPERIEAVVAQLVEATHEVSIRLGWGHRIDAATGSQL
jgi:DNA-binding IclR family transcriptional regulator